METLNIDYQILASIIYSIGYIVAVLMSCSYCDKAKKAGYNMEFQMVPIVSMFSWLWVILLAINWNEFKAKENGKL